MNFKRARSSDPSPAEPLRVLRNLTNTGPIPHVEVKVPSDASNEIQNAVQSPPINAKPHIAVLNPPARFNHKPLRNMREVLSVLYADVAGDRGPRLTVGNKTGVRDVGFLLHAPWTREATRLENLLCLKPKVNESVQVPRTNTIFDHDLCLDDGSMLPLIYFQPLCTIDVSEFAESTDSTTAGYGDEDKDLCEFFNLTTGKLPIFIHMQVCESDTVGRQLQVRKISEKTVHSPMDLYFAALLPPVTNLTDLQRKLLLPPPMSSAKDDIDTCYTSSDNSPRYLVAYLGAKWCPPCKKILPYLPLFFGSSSDQDQCPAYYGNRVELVKVDRDTASPLHELFHIEKIPTFLVWKKRPLVGANVTAMAKEFDAFFHSNVQHTPKEPANHNEEKAAMLKRAQEELKITEIGSTNDVRIIEDIFSNRQQHPSADPNDATSLNPCVPSLQHSNWLVVKKHFDMLFGLSDQETVSHSSDVIGSLSTTEATNTVPGPEPAFTLSSMFDGDDDF